MLSRNPEVRERFIRQISSNAGDAVLQALSEPGTIEVMLNPDGHLWHEKLGKDICEIMRRNPDGSLSPATMTSAQAAGMIKVIASYLDKTVTAENPILDNAEFPLDGSRFSAALPPVVSNPTFCIRRRPERIYPLDDYVKDGIMSPRQRDLICRAVSERKNIVVIGSTSSGKTTLTNAIINEIVRQFPLDRVFIFEDTAEIQCEGKNALFFHTSQNVGLIHLLKLALRMRPDCICVGEVRDHAALDLCDCWNTGHPGGICTIHADDATRGLMRLCSMISRHPNKPGNIQEIVADAVNIVIFIRKTPDHGRKIEEILEVDRWDSKEVRFRGRRLN